MDVKTTFFYRLVKEIIFVAKPTGYKLWKVLYGLKQLPWIWYQTLAKFYCKLGFRLFNADLNVFAKKDMIIVIYVDDFPICDAERKEINNIKNACKAKFYISDLEFVLFYLGIAVT